MSAKRFPINLKSLLILFLINYFFVTGCSPNSMTDTSSPTVEKSNSMTGLYQVIKPRLSGEGIWQLFVDVNGEHPKKVRVDELFSGWETKTEAEKDLTAILNTKGLKVSSAPLWSLGTPLDIIGTIEYEDGSIGKIAVAGWRVGFEDKFGKTWYFQWEERVPKEW